MYRLLFFIAGVDRKTMLECPATDRIWASHIGFSLCLSFIVVLGISFFATGYMIESWPLRGLMALIIATTVFMFDRALFQSDWFVQGSFYADDETGIRPTETLRQLAGRFLRVAVRLTMSLGLAWVIALFLELALFSDTISDKIERDRVANNKPVFEQIATYEVQLGQEIDARRQSLAALERSLLDALAATPDGSLAPPDDALGDKVRLQAEHEAVLRNDIRQIEVSIQQQTTDMNAEELGQKLGPMNSGRTGQGPRYEFAKRQKEALEPLLQSRKDELAQLIAQQDAVRKAEAERLAAASKAESDRRAALAIRRATLQVQVDAARADLQTAEADKTARLDAFRRNVMERSHIQAKRDAADPLTRIVAFQELKSDPKDGQIMTLFSWMTRFFIIFLEIVPVVAKIFFSPPSVYALKVQAELKRARQNVRRMMTTPEPSEARVGAALLSGQFSENWQLPAEFSVPRVAASERPKDGSRSPLAGWWRRASGGTPRQPDQETRAPVSLARSNPTITFGPVDNDIGSPDAASHTDKVHFIPWRQESEAISAAPISTIETASPSSVEPTPSDETRTADGELPPAIEPAARTTPTVAAGHAQQADGERWNKLTVEHTITPTTAEDWWTKIKAARSNLLAEPVNSKKTDAQDSSVDPQPSPSLNVAIGASGSH